MSIWHTRSRTGFLSSPALLSDLLTIRFVLDGRMIRRDHSEDHVARAGHAMLVAFEVMRDEEASSSFEAVSATISKSALVEAAAKLEGEKTRVLPDFAPVVDVVGLPLLSLLQTLRSIHARLLDGWRSADLVLPLMQEVAAYQILTCWPRRDWGTRNSAHAVGSRVVRKARDYIEAHLSRKLLLDDVAAAAGVGVRALQIAFRRELGVNPANFILGQRLDRARADLKAPTERHTSVRTIAERWGFSHMGDFGRRYRSRFGETPSASRVVSR